MNDALSKALEPRIETGRTLLIAGMNEHYTMSTRLGIPAQWTRFGPHIGKVPGQAGGVSYGVCWNFDAECGFDYLSGVEVSGLSGLPEDFCNIMVPAAKYAVFTHQGDVSAIPETIQRIWSEWAPRSGREIAQTPSFERYGENFDAKAGAGDVEIWIPVKT
ncbi:MAG: GyrI-like domain-containing protein [Candidatus Hydrogenedentes bacterium]|nr:GyrI-like domain-containing protein [Candidatus Hydrogenedentota bacterium]